VDWRSSRTCTIIRKMAQNRKGRIAAKRILVTGVAGFMGSHEAEALLKDGYEVYGLDDLSGGFMRNVPRGCRFTRLDLRQRDVVARYMRRVRPEIIFHDAADASEGRSQFTPINSTERNYLAYLNLLVPAVRYGLKKMVLASSMSVYGAQRPPFTEKQPRAPEDIYAIAKASMEHSTELLSQVHGFQYTIIRPHNVYGPRQNMTDPYRNVIAIFINSLMNGRPFYIYGDGRQKRSFTYIDDYTPYSIKAGLGKRFNGHIFNIGPRKEVSIKDLAWLILRIYFGNVKKCPHHLLPRFLPPRPLEVKLAFSSQRKAARLLGYKTSVPLVEGVRRMIAWTRSIGPQRCSYLRQGLELVSRNTPSTWTRKLY
jgi:UDP-glucose 4-epimerase